MDKKQKRKLHSLCEKFQILLQNASVKALQVETREHVSMTRAYGRNNALIGWKYTPYIDVIDFIGEFVSQVSKKTIAREVSASIIHLFEKHAVSEEAAPEAYADFDSIADIVEQSSLEDELAALLSRLESVIETRTAYVLLTGVEVLVPSLQLGDFVVYNCNSGPLIETLERKPIPDFDIRDYIREQDCYVAIPDLEGDVNFVTEKALKIAQAVIAILNFLLARPLERYTRIKVGEWKRSQVTVISQSNVDGKRNIHKDFLEIRNWGVDQGEINRLDKFQVIDKIIDCYKRGLDAPQGIHAKIWRSITWYSKAMNFDELEAQYLALAIALESLLLGKDAKNPRVHQGSISQKLAERVAFLLGNTYDKRIEIFAETKRLYGHRSRIVHEGQPVSRENVFYLHDLVLTVIVNLMNRNFEDWDAFLDFGLLTKMTMQ